MGAVTKTQPLSKPSGTACPLQLMLASTNSHLNARQSQNRFVQTSLAYSLTYACAIHRVSVEPVLITILADTDYYSQSKLSPEGVLPTSDRFLDFHVPLDQAHKTGLGSSAALVTAFVAAVVAYFVPSNILDTGSEHGHSIVHNLAQAAHCAAQGKVGSGFDVAAAVFGSCVYKRFSPRVLDGLDEIGTTGFSSRLKSVIDDNGLTKKWDMNIKKADASIPQGLSLVMCDVDCGSETVGMVKNVLAWKTQKPGEAVLLWASLQIANEDLAMRLRDLASQPSHSPNEYDALRSNILRIRSLIREMSQLTGVPIEPPIQTALIDACCELPGIIGGVVPGAGGYDAIALLVEDKRTVIENLRQLLDTYRADPKNDKGSGIGNVRLLGAKQEYQGLKIEHPSIYHQWLR